MEEKNESKSSDVMKAIEKIVANDGSVLEGNKGIDLLAIVKKVNRNRRKGDPLE